jgi:hypothetical protein
MRVRGMAEILRACQPTPDAATSLPCGRTWCSARNAAVGRWMFRRPIGS